MYNTSASPCISMLGVTQSGVLLTRCMLTRRVSKGNSFEHSFDLDQERSTCPLNGQLESGIDRCAGRGRLSLRGNRIKFTGSSEHDQVP